MTPHKEIPDGWTIKAAVYHIESLLEEMDKRYEQRFEAQETAVSAALASRRQTVAIVMAILTIVVAIVGSAAYIIVTRTH